MKFINRGEDVQVRMDEGQRYNWVLAYKNQVVELPEAIGNLRGFEKVNPKTTIGKIGKVKVETKQIEHDSYVEGLKDGIAAERDGVIYTPDDLFFKELKGIKGIGPKTAKDIVEWGTKEKLLEKINKKENLPFRDDVEQKLGEHYA